MMTYMYHGTVSVPHNKLQTFLKTAEALKIKGIVDTSGMEGRQGAGQDQTSPAPPGPVSQVGELVTAGPAPVHPAGDLSLLATAAVEQHQPQLDSIVQQVANHYKTLHFVKSSKA